MFRCIYEYIIVFMHEHNSLRAFAMQWGSYFNALYWESVIFGMARSNGNFQTKCHFWLIESWLVEHISFLKKVIFLDQSKFTLKGMHYFLKSLAQPYQDFKKCPFDFKSTQKSSYSLPVASLLKYSVCKFNTPCSMLLEWVLLGVAPKFGIDTPYSTCGGDAQRGKMKKRSAHRSPSLW